MTDPQALRDLAEIRALTDELNPAAVLSKVAELTRGGLPGQSMSDGRGGGEGVPGFDKDDRALKREAKVFTESMWGALKLLRTAQRAQSGILEVAKEVTPDPPCTNAGCENVITDARHIECARCRQHRHRHGATWPTQRSLTAAS